MRRVIRDKLDFLGITRPKGSQLFSTATYLVIGVICLLVAGLGLVEQFPVGITVIIAALGVANLAIRVLLSRRTKNRD